MVTAACSHVRETTPSWYCFVFFNQRLLLQYSFLDVSTKRASVQADAAEIPRDLLHYSKTFICDKMQSYPYLWVFFFEQIGKSGCFRHLYLNESDHGGMWPNRIQESCCAHVGSRCLLLRAYGLACQFQARNFSVTTTEGEYARSAEPLTLA